MTYLILSNLCTGLYYLFNYFSPNLSLPVVFFSVTAANILLSCLVFFILPSSTNNVRTTTLLMFFSNLPLFLTLFVLAFKIGSYYIISFSLLNLYWSFFSLTFLFYCCYLIKIEDKLRPKLNKLQKIFNNSYFKLTNLLFFIAYLIFMYVRIHVYANLSLV